MAFEQTRDVLDKAKKFHHELQAFYRTTEETAGRERVRMVLDYLAQREAALEAQLAEYERVTSSAVLDTWFTYAPAQHIGEALARVRLRTDATVPEVLGMALQLDESLLQLYRQSAEVAPTETHRELFMRLYEEGRQARTCLVLALFEPE